jgi:hypothetical protein
MATKMVWEYRVVSIGSMWGAKGEQIEAGLNELGLEAWEVLEVELPHNGDKLLVIAKRPLSPGQRRRRRESPAPT